MQHQEVLLNQANTYNSDIQSIQLSNDPNDAQLTNQSVPVTDVKTLKNKTEIKTSKKETYA